MNKGLNEELLPVLLPVLHHKSFAKSFCQGHILNGCCEKVAFSLNSKFGLYILSHPRKHRKYVFFSIFIFFCTFRKDLHALSEMIFKLHLSGFTLLLTLLKNSIFQVAVLRVHKTP